MTGNSSAGALLESLTASRCGQRLHTNDSASSANYEFATDPAAGGAPVLHAVVSNQTGWDTYDVGVTDVEAFTELGEGAPRRRRTRIADHER